MSEVRLANLAEFARREGWATGVMPLPILRLEASKLGWTPVPTRKGEEPVVELRPKTSDEASPRSLSAIHGLNAQPLHTDGAHFLDPPDFVVLHAEDPNDVATLLWSPLNKKTNSKYPVIPAPEYLQGGMFVVGGGAEKFLASAGAAGVRYRYDPGCMIPCDERARKVVRYFEEVAKDAYIHEWTKPQQFLLISNRTALHARADANNSSDRIITRIAYQAEISR
ncbi:MULTISPECIES: hypothetical protein [Actinoalloteichus]|uniref:hypothetical protein n=1 Tax=Actinoalloteichus TaxID=65496 RepID=UPI0012F7F7BE|nr:MULTISPECIES: hypothetical protein [Actinoalloteichus]